METSDIGRRRERALSASSPAYVEKRRLMVSAAAELFRDKGYEATTLADVAASVGVDRASLYYYFGGKDELLRETVTGVSANNLELMEGLRNSELSAVDRIRAFVTGVITSYDKHYHEISVFLRDGMPKIRDEDGPWSREMRHQIHDFEVALRELLADGVREGELRDDLDPRLVAQALWGMLNWMHRWHRPLAVPAGRIATSFVDVLLFGVLAPEPGTR
jgi:TetR/AcrR family transcriptional regulator, cholesterol catabolism regulator